MKWQRISGLLLAGAGLLALTLWLTRSPSAPAEKPASPAPTNAVAQLHRPGGRPAGTIANRRAAQPPRQPANPRLASNRFAHHPSTPLGKNPRVEARGAKPTPEKVAQVQTPPTLRERLAHLAQGRYFYPAMALVPLCLGAIFLLIASKTPRDKAADAGGALPIPTRAKLAKQARGKAAIHACNVLRVSPDERQVWNFGTRNGGFALNREASSRGAEPLPPKLVGKEWHSLWQPRLNIAWFPPGQVFFRVAQFPMAELSETLSMVELQLEKLSPIPVAQVAWTMHVLAHPQSNMQTVIVVLVARSLVEEFLGQLEQQGYLADRLELSFIDQLQATPVTANGAWLYPIPAGIEHRAMVAWWYDGVLRDLGAVTLPATDKHTPLKEQLLQLSWAGELEGWLTGKPSWHLVADAAGAAQWEPALRTALEQPVEVLPPLALGDLAARTATRGANAETRVGLLPPEFSARYRQQFVDRLWMRALAAAVGLYIAGVAVYMVALQFALFRTRAVEAQVTDLAPAYTNAIHLKAQMKVLKERQNLKYAALDCWNAVATLLPANVELESFNFSDGQHLTLTGTAPRESGQDLIKFDGALRKATSNDKLLFDPNKGDFIQSRQQGANLAWSLSVELKHTEAP